MKNIAFTIATPDFTGAPKMGYFFAKACVDAGHRVFAVCGRKPEKKFGGADEFPSVIDALQSEGVKVFEEGGFRKLLDMKLVNRVAEIIRVEGVTHVVSMGQMDLKIAAWAAHKAKVPCIVSAQNRTRFGGNAFWRAVKRCAYGFMLRNWTDLVVCTSTVVRDEVTRDYGVDVSKTALLMNGIDVFGFPTFDTSERWAARQELGIGRDDVVLVNVGRLDPQKGQDVLLNAFAEVKPISRPMKLVLVGNVNFAGTADSEKYEKSLNDIIQEKNLDSRVVFTGWRNDIPRLLNAADIYVHSALWEGFPLALVEAMAARLPVIGTDCSGHPEGFVNGTHGYIVPTNDAAALARAMDRLSCLSDADRKVMGDRNVNLALEHHDIRQIGSRFVQLVDEVVSTHAR